MNSYCLICNRDIRAEGSLEEMFYVNDCICSSCRAQLAYFPRTIKTPELRIEGLYLYQGLLRDTLIQFKEYNDEALYPLFLYPCAERLKRRYRGYELLPLPSSSQALERRGFKPVDLIFSLLGLPVIDGLYKKNDIDQKSRTFKQRRQIYGQIALKDGISLEGKKILLVDDIVTSGATMRAGYRLVRGRAAEVKALTMSYNQRFLSQPERLFQKIFL
ncbi:MAG: ComF family protein [Erysipelotrichaceae bacterium]|nr:ComF family protein [Erysipelotrichaceae bacterium]